MYWAYLIGSIIRVPLVFSTSELIAKILLFKIPLSFLGPPSTCPQSGRESQALLLAWPWRAQPSLTFLVSSFYIHSGGLPSFSSSTPVPSFSSSEPLKALLFHQPLADLIIPLVDASTRAGLQSFLSAQLTHASSSQGGLESRFLLAESFEGGNTGSLIFPC